MLEANMGISTTALWLSLLTGFGLAVLYDAFRVVRVTVSGRAGTSVVLDFFYLLFCGLITYLAAIAVDFGRVRFFLLACEVIGACVYFLTIGALTHRLALGLHRIFCWGKKLLLRIFVRPVRFCIGKCRKLLVFLGQKWKKFLGKKSKKRKNTLKRAKGLVYNQTVDVSKHKVIGRRAGSAKGEQRNEGNRRQKETK